MKEQEEDNKEMEKRSETEERLAGRKGASRVALNGLSPLEQPDASRTDVSSGVIQFMKPWTHSRTHDAYVCMRAFYFAGVWREWTGNGPT